MRLSSLIPREERFFDMFDEASAVLTRASARFLEMVTEFDRLTERSQELKREEHEVDQVIGKIIQALDSTFITPLDREDIHSLASALDDVMDNMEETAHLFAVFRIERPTPQAVSMARLIRDACHHLEGAIRLLRSLKNA